MMSADVTDVMDAASTSINGIYPRTRASDAPRQKVRLWSPAVSAAAH